jgi:hypothetical protein
MNIQLTTSFRAASLLPLLTVINYQPSTLAQVTALPLTRWNYTADPGTAHPGPGGQDFKAGFGLGGDDTSIAIVDAAGVALAAIQGLNQKVEAQPRGIGT